MGEKADFDRLHESVYNALRLIEDNDLVGVDLVTANRLADELLQELARLQG